MIVVTRLPSNIIFTAHVKSNLRLYVNSGNNILNAKEFVEAVNAAEITATVAVECSVSISKPHNFEFSKKGVRCWRQYDVSKGKYFSLKIDSSFGRQGKSMLY